MLQCVAVCCRCCSVLQRVAACCSVLQCVVVCRTPQHDGSHAPCPGLRDLLCCSTLLCVAVCCCVLQCGAVCCGVLQCAAIQGLLDLQTYLINPALRVFMSTCTHMQAHTRIQTATYTHTYIHTHVCSSTEHFSLCLN